MEKNINLDIDTILNKEFNVDFKGYSPVEVDQFLDLVVKDYQSFQKAISNGNDMIAYYRQQIDTLNAQVLELENKLKAAESAAANNTAVGVNNLSQVDILRRLARLEKEIFNNK